MNKLNRFKELKKEIAAYRMLLNIQSFDQYTIAPKFSKELSSSLSSIVASKLFELETAEELESLTKELSIDASIDDGVRKELLLDLKEIDHKKCIPLVDYKKGLEAFDKAVIAWESAREHKDYNLFKDALKQSIHYRKLWIEYRKKNISMYNQMLDDYQPGSSIETYDSFFTLIKNELVPFIRDVIASKKVINLDKVLVDIDLDKQKKVVRLLADYLNFKEEFSYIGESSHPFSMFINKNNIRITTRYIQNNILSTFFSVAHEIGHGMYSQNVDYPYVGSNKESYISMGMHESQSRFLENNICKSYSFWKYFYPKLQELVPNFKEIALDDFYACINKVELNLIRTESDELTYPIHVLIRYEIEKELIDGTLDIDNLNTIWNQKYQDYLGITPENDLDGVLQDIHWTDSFGYFPTYALGSAIAAQIHHYLLKSFDMEAKMLNGDISSIQQWLKEHIHRYGGLLDYNEILLKATKEVFNPQYYIDYLKNKYKKIYNL